MHPLSFTVGRDTRGTVEGGPGSGHDPVTVVGRCARERDGGVWVSGAESDESGRPVASRVSSPSTPSRALSVTLAPSAARSVTCAATPSPAPDPLRPPPYPTHGTDLRPLQTRRGGPGEKMAARPGRGPVGDRGGSGRSVGLSRPYLIR